jgi:hypothetical protein
MTSTTATTEPLTVDAAVERVRTHTRALRGLVDDGRLHLLEAELEAREAALVALRARLEQIGDPRPAAVERALQELRAEDRELLEWMRSEKQDVGRALASMRAGRVDPYGEGAQGPVMLDRRS